MARSEAVQGNGTDPHSGEPIDRIAHRLKHPPDLLIAALSDLHFHPRGFPPPVGANYPRPGRQRALTEKGHPRAQLLQRIRIRDPAHFSHIDLGHPVAGMSHLLGKGAVVGEDQQPFRLGIQTAHRMQARHGGIPAAKARLQRGDYQFHHRIRGVGIVTRGHVAFRLVQQDVEVLHMPRDRLPVHRNVVALRVDPMAEFPDHLTIDCYFPTRDQALGVAPRGDAGACENFLQPLLHIGYLARGARG